MCKESLDGNNQPANTERDFDHEVDSLLSDLAKTAAILHQIGRLDCMHLVPSDSNGGGSVLPSKGSVDQLLYP